MADVEVNIGSGDSGRIEKSKITVGDVTGRDRMGSEQSGHSEEARLHAIIETQERRIEELERFVFGDNRLGVFSVREEIRGLKFWISASTVVTIVWVVYEIFRATR